MRIPLENQISEMERLIQIDPANRGLVGYSDHHPEFLRGELLGAALEIAQTATHVGIVTGFFVPDADQPAAETDGPLGAICLAQLLMQVGIETHLITDAACAPVMRAACIATDYPQSRLLVAEPPWDPWIEIFFNGEPTRSMTHLISIERVGPSYCDVTLQLHPATTETCLADFLLKVPKEQYNRCLNMRGECIDLYSGELHKLFEVARDRGIRTIGIGDGGNEIGMGKIPWRELIARYPFPHQVAIPCRIATDWIIVAGTSNWAGYALTAAVLLLRDQVSLLTPWDSRQQLNVLNDLLQYGRAIDGITRRSEPTVDSLPFVTYIQPWIEIRRLLGFPD